MKAQYTIRIEEKLLEKAKIIADQEVRSLNNLFEYFVHKGITEYEAENGAISLSDK